MFAVLVEPAQAHFGLAHHKLHFGSQGDLLGLLHPVKKCVEVIVVAALGVVDFQGHRSLPLRLWVQRIDAPDVDNVCRAEKVAHAPFYVLLARPKEDPVVVVEIRKELQKLDL